MAEFVPLCTLAELPVEGEAKEITVGATTLCVARVNGEIAALANDCPHRGGPLGQGLVEEGRVVCPWHAWAFDVKDGTALHDEAAKVRIYEVRIEGNQALVKL